MSHLKHPRCGLVPAYAVPGLHVAVCRVYLQGVSSDTLRVGPQVLEYGSVLLVKIRLLPRDLFNFVFASLHAVHNTFKPASGRVYVGSDHRVVGVHERFFHHQLFFQSYSHVETSFHRSLLRDLVYRQHLASPRVRLRAVTRDALLELFSVGLEAADLLLDARSESRDAGDGACDGLDGFLGFHNPVVCTGDIFFDGVMHLNIALLCLCPEACKSGSSSLDGLEQLLLLDSMCVESLHLSIDAIDGVDASLLCGVFNLQAPVYHRCRLVANKLCFASMFLKLGPLRLLQ
mmetsp:Transcript_1987/g.4520  ORF Transcript_1987/g.4520 Transcript_1987/m.4520 type:complete len:289 (+) Transcript_1987:1934-2800(+)